MNLLSIENVSKSYGEKLLFSDLSFGIEDGEKIGLLGVNGTGKTTLLKIIAGVEFPDQGRVTLGHDVKVEYLPQNPDLDNDLTVMEQVFKGNSPMMRVLREYEYTLQRVSQFPADKILQAELTRLTQDIDALGAWQLESEAKMILTKLGITDFEVRVGTLSGGQRKRLALSCSLISSADLLILDEPTNHLDNETIAWLEEYLNKRKGALLMVTHDRYFLDRVTNRILELDQGRLARYLGNYSYFLEKKLEKEEQLAATEKKRQNLLRNELAWIKRGARARSTKQKARIERFERLKAQKAESNSSKVEISAGSSRLGKKVVELNRVSKDFDGTRVIADFSYILARNSRIGIIGPNGIGKSTLLNIIAGRLSPDEGIVEWGQTVKIGCFLQENSEMDGNLKVIEYIKEVGEYLPTADGERISAAQMLEKFLFPPKVQWTPIAKLSGGEKRRLYLLRILMGAPNLLLLDEPTNDLDIETLTILEDYLDSFKGAVIVVSHDRYFLDRVVDRVLAFTGNGRILEYMGNYTDYEEANRKLLSEQVKKPEKNKENFQPEQKKEKPLKLTYKEELEYREIEGVIAVLEQELAAVNEKMSSEGSNFVLLQELSQQQQELEARLEEKIERWTYLNELVEEIAEKKGAKFS